MEPLVLQWNCKGLIGQWAENKQFFLQKNPNIIALQETWFRDVDNYNFTLPAYSLYRCDYNGPDRRRGGVATYIKNNLPHHVLLLPEFEDVQAVGCTLTINGQQIDLINIYVRPRCSISTFINVFNILMASCTNPLLLVGDMNAHNPLWGDRTLDDRGRFLERLIGQHNLVLLNDGSPTYHHLPTNTNTMIDLSLCSASIASRFYWWTDGDVRTSDHYPIYLLSTSTPPVTPWNKRWNIKRADWASFTAHCQLTPLEHSQSCEDMASSVAGSILSAAHRTVPQVGKPKKHAPVPWFTNEIRQAIARRKRAFRRHLRLNTVTTRLDVCRERAIV